MLAADPATALWHAPSLKTPLPIRWVLVRDPLDKFKTAAFCCTNPTTSAEHILTTDVQR